MAKRGQGKHVIVHPVEQTPFQNLFQGLDDRLVHAAPAFLRGHEQEGVLQVNLVPFQRRQVSEALASGIEAHPHQIRPFIREPFNDGIHFLHREGAAQLLFRLVVRPGRHDAPERIPGKDLPVYSDIERGGQRGHIADDGSGGNALHFRFYKILRHPFIQGGQRHIPPVPQERQKPADGHAVPLIGPLLVFPPVQPVKKEPRHRHAVHGGFQHAGLVPGNGLHLVQVKNPVTGFFLHLLGHQPRPGFILGHDRFLIGSRKQRLGNHVDAGGFPKLFAVQGAEDGHPFVVAFDDACHSAVQSLDNVQLHVQGAFFCQALSGALKTAQNVGKSRVIPSRADENWHRVRDSNPCCPRERRESWTARRTRLLGLQGLRGEVNTTGSRKARII